MTRPEKQVTVLLKQVSEQIENDSDSGEEFEL